VHIELHTELYLRITSYWERCHQWLAIKCKKFGF